MISNRFAFCRFRCNRWGRQPVSGVCGSFTPGGGFSERSESVGLEPTEREKLDGQRDESWCWKTGDEQGWNCRWEPERGGKSELHAEVRRGREMVGAADGGQVGIMVGRLSGMRSGFQTGIVV